METTLYILRHGETEWNRKGLPQGQLTSNLTPEGIEKTESFSKEITKLNPDVIFCSDQPRAVITAEILTRDLHKKIEFHPGLREMVFLPLRLPLNYWSMQPLTDTGGPGNSLFFSE